ncbi:hypothetical protein [Salmonella enterica]|uniref:hypothetical protein n=1 Tax=Salmonella enterica TaxID=28901 RepID=UPI0012EFD9B7|nr:hypothetical protein [Salmonella enterica]EBQ9005097.1 hypothetical protein [Salmonella enterica subsp. enterica serovar Blockley]ECW2126455.1 hypothetical protein [Salmonella enterica]
MRFDVSMDTGIAIDLDKVAAILRPQNHKESRIVLVSGSIFDVDMPFSETIKMVEGPNKRMVAAAEEKVKAALTRLNRLESKIDNMELDAAINDLISASHSLVQQCRQLMD